MGQNSKTCQTVQSYQSRLFLGDLDIYAKMPSTFQNDLQPYTTKESFIPENHALQILWLTVRTKTSWLCDFYQILNVFHLALGARTLALACNDENFKSRNFQLSMKNKHKPKISKKGVFFASIDVKATQWCKTAENTQNNILSEEDLVPSSI